MILGTSERSIYQIVAPESQGLSEFFTGELPFSEVY